VELNLGGPPGDPDDIHWLTIALATVALQEMGEDVSEELTMLGEANKDWHQNFIETAKRRMRNG
jgi:hypothetical protein